jgi:hypothetical protein
LPAEDASHRRVLSHYQDHGAETCIAHGTGISATARSHLLCAELKALADDRFNVLGDADRALALAMGSGARARMPDERFARPPFASAMAPG